MTPGLRRAGVVLVVAYAAVAVVTFELATGPARPLFDGFAPPVPYNWVRPPPELASTNVPPPAAELTIPLGEVGSEAANASTSDAQILVTLPEGVVTPHPPDTAVRLTITPRDAGTLAPLPPDLRAASNAYEIRLAYQPSQAPATVAGAAGQVGLTGGVQGDGLLYSADGQSWQPLRARPYGNTHGMIGPFQGPGYYLVTASPAVTTTGTLADQTPGGGVGAALAVTAVVGAIAIVVAVITTRARNKEDRPAKGGAGRRPGKAGKPRKPSRAGNRRRRRP